MSTHNIRFHGEIRKYLPDTHSYLELFLNNGIGARALKLGELIANDE